MLRDRAGPSAAHAGTALDADAFGVLTVKGKAQALGKLAALAQQLPQQSPTPAESARKCQCHSRVSLPVQLKHELNSVPNSFQLRAAVLQHVPEHAALFTGLLKQAERRLTQWFAGRHEPVQSWQRPRAPAQVRLRADIAAFLLGDETQRRFRAFESKQEARLQLALICDAYKTNRHPDQLLDLRVHDGPHELDEELQV